METSIRDSALTAWLGPARTGMPEHVFETYARLVRDQLSQHPEWTASADARADHAEDIEWAHRHALRLAEATRWHDPGGGDQRPAEAGERCTCGRAAVVVFDTLQHGEVPSCRRS